MATTSTTHSWEHSHPQSLPEGATWLWSRVLFPGEPPSVGRINRVVFGLLLLLPCPLLYGDLSHHLFEPDESRYAEIPREMLDRGDWIVPHLQGEPYLDKPPLLYWLVMMSYQLFGVSAWSARLIPAGALHTTILLTYLFGRRHLGERSALWGTVFLTVAPGFIVMGRLLILDGLLTLWTAASTWAALEAIRQGQLRRTWWRISWLATGLGILTKGPVALVLVLIPIWVYSRLQRISAVVGSRSYVEYVLGSLAISLPWYVAIGFREPVFLRYFLWEHNVVRFFAPFDHIRPIWFYLPIAWAGLLPAAWFLPGLVSSFLRRPTVDSPPRPRELGFYFLAGCWVLLFFSLSGSKLPTYILPAFPISALGFGWYVAQGKRWVRRLAAGLAAISFILLVVFNLFLIPWYAKLRSPMGEPDKVIPYCADRCQPVLCFPRSCDSVAFYLERDDLRNIRSKNFPELIDALRQNPRTVLLCTHRHSFESIRLALPSDLRIAERVAFRRDIDTEVWYDKLASETPWGLCDLLVIERNR